MQQQNKNKMTKPQTNTFSKGMHKLYKGHTRVGKETFAHIIGHF
jgi:hypothetical protein